MCVGTWKEEMMTIDDDSVKNWWGYGDYDYGYWERF